MGWNIGERRFAKKDTSSVEETENGAEILTDPSTFSMLEEVKNLIENNYLNDVDSDLLSAYLFGRRRHDEVADARQSAERVLRAAHFQPQTADFGNAARDEGGAGVVAVAQPAGNADGERLYVLHRAAQLHAEHVRVRILLRPEKVKPVLNLTARPERL